MDRGLLFLTLALVCFYFVFDDLFGKGKIKGVAEAMAKGIPVPSIKDRITNGGKNGQKMEDHIKDTKEHRPSTGYFPMG
jgi:hypothetical protein